MPHMECGSTIFIHMIASTSTRIIERFVVYCEIVYAYYHYVNFKQLLYDLYYVSF